MCRKLLLPLLLLALPFHLLSQKQKLDSLYKALSTAKEDSNKVDILNDLAFDLYSNKPDSTILLAQQAVALSDKIGYTDGKVNAYNNLGIGFCTKGDYSGSLTSFQEEVQALETKGDKSRAASTYGNMGNVYRLMGDYPKALEDYLKALGIAEQIGNKTRQASVLSNIGILYKEQDNYSKALDYYKKALKLAEELGDKKLQLNNLNNMANALGAIGDKTGALETHEKALQMARENDNKEVEATNLGNIGNIYTERGDYAKAMDYLQQALKLAEDIGQKPLQASALANLGLMYTKTKKYKEAEQYLKQAIALDSALGNKNKLKDFEFYISNLYLAEGDYKLAYSSYKKAMALKDSLFNMDRDKALTRKELTYEYDKKEALLKANQDKKDALAKAEERKQRIITGAVLGGLLLTLAFSVFIFRSWRLTRKQRDLIEVKNQETERQKNLIEQQKALVEEKNKEVIDSITYAKRLQDAILPPLSEIKKYLPESFVLYKPKAIVAGDFYWMERVGNNILVAAADCTGHGVPGAMVSVVCSNALNRTVKEFKITEPGKILDRVRELVLETFEKSEGEIKDGMDISLASLTPSEGGITIKWAGANNSLWYMEKGELKELPPDKQPIGQHDNPKPFTTHTFTIPPKSGVIYLFTDGYADQFGGEKGKKFKYKQLQQLLMANAQLPMQEQKEVLEKAFENWKGNLEQTDDVCVIGIRI